MDKPTPRLTLPRSARIHGRNEFRRIFGKKLRASDRWLILYVDQGPTNYARLGISASRRLGKAVQRNRIKRLVREAFRQIRHQLPAGTDWIVIPKPGSETSVEELQQSIIQLAKKLATKL